MSGLLVALSDFVLLFWIGFTVYAFDVADGMHAVAAAFRAHRVELGLVFALFYCIYVLRAARSSDEPRRIVAPLAESEINYAKVNGKALRWLEPGKAKGMSAGSLGDRRMCDAVAPPRERCARGSSGVTEMILGPRSSMKSRWPALREFLHRFGRETNQEVVVAELSGAGGSWFFRIKEYDD